MPDAPSKTRMPQYIDNNELAGIYKRLYNFLIDRFIWGSNDKRKLRNYHNTRVIVINNETGSLSRDNNTNVKLDEFAVK